MSNLRRFATLVERVIEDRAELVTDAGDTLYDPWRVPYPVVIDIVCASTYNDALAKLIIATRERYPWLTISADLATAEPHVLTSDYLARRHMLNIARRIYADVEGLDVLWRLLASRHDRTEHFGFMARLSDLVAVTDHQRPEDAVVSTSELNLRINRLERIAAGIDTLEHNVFSAISDGVWEHIVDADDKARATARAEAAVASAAATAVVCQPDFDQDESDDPDIEPSPPPPAGVRIIPVRSTPPAGPVRWLVTNLAPIVYASSDVAAVAAQLRAEFPHAGQQIARLLTDIRGCEPVSIRPTLIVGSPGCGKSRVVRRLSELLRVPLRRYDAASVSDNSFGGTPKQWATARPSIPLTAVAELRVANPILLIDELDKSGSGGRHGSLDQALLAFLERETARRYPDCGVELEVDLSHVSYVATANSDGGIPSHLLDRFRIVRWPDPTVEMLPDLCRSVLSDLADDMRLDQRFLPPLTGDEMDVIEQAWSRGRPSIRRLQTILRATLTARETCALKH